MIKVGKGLVGLPRPLRTRPIRRRRQFWAAVLVGLAALYVQQAAAYAAVAMATSASTHACRKVRSGLAPLPYAQSILANAREDYEILSEAVTPIHDRDKVVLRLELKDVRQRLNEIGEPPSERLVRAQIRIVQHDLKQGSSASNTGEWDTLAADIEQYLSGTIDVDHDWVMSKFQAARSAMLDGRRKQAAADLERLNSAIARRFDAFPISLAHEDVASALKAAHEPDPLWQGVRTAVQQAMDQLDWTVRGNPVPLLQAYYATSDAIDSCAAYSRGARRLLREAADALGKRSPKLAAEAKRLSAESKPGTAEMVKLQVAIRDAIAKAQKRAGDNFVLLPSAVVGTAPIIEMKSDPKKASH